MNRIVKPEKRVMQDDTSRRRLLEAGAVGALAGLGGCLRLTAGEDATTDAATTGDEARTERTTEGDDERDDTDTESESESDRPSLEISGPSTVDHRFVDSRNRMAQPDATAPATAPVVDWEAGLEAGLNSRYSSGPIVTADAIVVSTYRDVVAYERGDGAVRWRLSESAVDDYRRVAAPHHRDDGVVLVGRNDRTGEWELAVFEAADGRKRSSVTIPVADEEQPRGSIVDGNRAVVVTATRADATNTYADLFVVNLESQSVTYEARLADAQLYPEDLAIDDDTLVVTTDEAVAGVDNVVAFDLAERERRWSKRLPIGEPVPALGDDAVYLPTETDVSNAAIRALSRTDGSELWQFELRDAPRSGVTVAHDSVYAVSNNTMYALEAADGTPTWSYSPSADPRIRGASGQLPVATGEHLLLGSDLGDGEGVVRAITAADGELAWRFDVPLSTVYSPVVVDDHLYVLGRDRGDDTGSIYALH